jgi:cysteine desulfurase/selenocysteine lyase
VRHGCFCAHPYLMRLLGHTREDVHRYRNQVRHGDRSAMPGAIRASAGISTTEQDVTRLLAAVTRVASTPPPIDYRQDKATGDYHPCGDIPGQPPQP